MAISGLSHYCCSIGLLGALADEYTFLALAAPGAVKNGVSWTSQAGTLTLLRGDAAIGTRGASWDITSLISSSCSKDFSNL